MGVHDRITTVISTKGQVILPKAIRDSRRWPAGTRLEVEDTPEGVLLRPVPIFPRTTLDDVVGCLRPRNGISLTIEDMDAAIEKEARRRARD